MATSQFTQLVQDVKNKVNDEKNNLESIKDIHGRIESIDQSVRSVNNRLRAVEKRLSVMNRRSKSSTDPEDHGNEDIFYEIEELRESVEVLNQSAGEIIIHERFDNIEEKLVQIEKEFNEAHKADVTSLKELLSDSQHRINKLENLNKITIGKIKIPIELSGLIAAFVLIGTGYLIANGQWGIIRSSYYPVSIGILFGVVVIAKFVMTNRNAI